MSTTIPQPYHTSLSDSPPSGSAPFQIQPQNQQNGGQAHPNHGSNLYFCRALYDYNEPGAGTLKFIKDEIIEIMSREPSGWWDGLVGQERGWFPSNYVIVITEVEARAAMAAWAAL
ncbi:SH3 domain-containing protein [Crepidotus variabilis]|uniref:SH3 domain-containing protein n=1 Tax=Crepidotus variabilis TaxID=179855 RepID=A0A9P6ENE7_9AGAR|nr:SH3 domain-containing protein [Crepidotus variabilis]